MTNIGNLNSGFMVAQGDCDGEMRRTADIGIAFQNAVILFLKGTALAVPRKWNGRNRASQASEKLVKSILRGRIVSGHDFSRAVSASESMRASAPEGRMRHDFTRLSEWHVAEGE